MDNRQFYELLSKLTPGQSATFDEEGENFVILDLLPDGDLLIWDKTAAPTVPPAPAILTRDGLIEDIDSHYRRDHGIFC